MYIEKYIQFFFKNMINISEYKLKPHVLKHCQQKFINYCNIKSTTIL